ncbi:hypothetical protein KZW07_30830, partial [Klebsiella pneumoniae]|nr:hypothetical protein [Klebsiella pneumoniae]
RITVHLIRLPSFVATLQATERLKLGVIGLETSRPRDSSEILDYIHNQRRSNVLCTIARNPGHFENMQVARYPATVNARGPGALSVQNMGLATTRSGGPMFTSGTCRHHQPGRAVAEDAISVCRLHTPSGGTNLFCSANFLPAFQVA